MASLSATRRITLHVKRTNLKCSLVLYFTHTLLFTHHFIFRRMLCPTVFNKDVTCNWTLKVDVNRLWLHKSARNCGSSGKPETQNKYACCQDGCRRVIIYFSTEHLGGENTEDNCCLSLEHQHRLVKQQLRWIDKKRGTCKNQKKKNQISMYRRSLVWWGLNLHPISLLAQYCSCFCLTY